MNQIDINRLDLNVLKVFEALHDEGGASRAALRLGVTQSAVSAALRRLRTIYGDPLFVRTGRGLAPTARANDLRSIVSEAQAKCRQSFAMPGPGPNGYEGRSVAIGMSDDFEIAIGRQLVDAVASRMPGLRLIFRQTHSQAVAGMLSNRDIDLAITSGGVSSRALSRQVLGAGGYASVVDQDSLRRSAGALTLEDFLQRDHILISSGGYIGIVDEALAALNAKRRVLASTTHFAALAFLLAGSDAVATVPTHAAHAIARLAGLQVVACPLTLPGYSIELGWRNEAMRDSAVTGVRHTIVERFGPSNSAPAAS